MASLRSGGAHDDRLTGGSHWENNGWCLVGRDEVGRDVMVWSGLYIVRGASHGPWIEGSFAVPQTVAIAVDEASRGQGIQDNDFVIGGTHHNGEEYRRREQLLVEQRPDAVRWELAGKVHKQLLDGWQIISDHAGISLDVSIAPLSQAWSIDETFGQVVRGFQQQGTFQGEWALPGEERVSVAGWGQHEKYHLPTPPRSLQEAQEAHRAQPMRDWAHATDHVVWQCGFSDTISYFVQSSPSLPGTLKPFARVRAHGKDFVLDDGTLTVREADRWVDPRSGIEMPTRVHLTVDSRSGVLDVELRSHARAYYFWDYERYRYSVLYWFLATAEGSWTSPETGRLDLSGLRCMTHTNRPISSWFPYDT